MIDAIRTFFHKPSRSEQAADDDEEHSLKLATAALLVEMTQADFKERESQTRAAAESVRRLFDLPADEVDTLLELAREEVREGVSLHQFTSLINKAFDRPSKETRHRDALAGSLRQRAQGQARGVFGAQDRRSALRAAQRFHSNAPPRRGVFGRRNRSLIPGKRCHLRRADVVTSSGGSRGVIT